ncbi:hypothetical protein GCM10028771_36190 [Nocardioides marmoraquaticus]
MGPGSYALLLRGPGPRPWLRPLAGVVLLALGAVLVAPLLLQPLYLVGLRLEGGAVGEVTASYLLYVNLSIAALVPLSFALAWWLHGVRPRWLTSVAPGLRWRLLLACTGLAVVSLFLALVVGALLPMGDVTGVEGSGGAGEVGSSAALVAAVVLLTTPLQAIGEEYGYRGYLLQAVGAMSGRPWVAVAVSSLVFALAHGTQNPPLFLDRLAFGVIAGTTVVLLGGLEAGIAMHVVNNLVAFGLAIATGSVAEALTVSEVSWWRILVTVTQHGSYLLLVLWAARRLGVRAVAPARDRAA